jgi:putative tricarboxylic transport membrane protein
MLSYATPPLSTNRPTSRSVQHSRIGIYSINSLPTDVMFIAFFGLVGYALIKFGFEPAPLLLGFVLGKLMEENLRRALIISRGDMMTFLDHSVSAGLLAAALIVLALALLPTLRKGRDEVFVE